MLSAVALSVVLSATSAPPGQVVNHAQTGHYAQPTVREYERFQTDHCRRVRYENYVAALDKEWQLYRDSGSTSIAFAQYKAAARQLKQDYVWTDPYLAPVLPGTGTPGAYSRNAGSNGLCAGDESGASAAGSAHGGCSSCGH